MKRLSKKELKKNREWKQWLFWLPDIQADRNLNVMEDYDPEEYKDAFFRFQSRGPRCLSEEELNGIQPLIAGQRIKEITISSLVEECMEFWADDMGCVVPIAHTFMCNKTDECKLDRLTIMALIKIYRQLEEDSVEYFSRTTCISDELKCKHYNNKLHR